MNNETDQNDSNTDENFSDGDSIQHDTTYKMQSLHSAHVRELNEFFSDAKMINQSGDPTTNIVDRYKGKCYKVPDIKIPKFFKILENCRKAGDIRIMFCERQQEYSGIMLDFDIYQSMETDQLSNETFHLLCQKISQLLMKLLKFTNPKDQIHIGVTRRPKITYNDEKQCYKDGFHILIPSIKVTREVKRLIISKLIKNEIIDQIMSDVHPADLKMSGMPYKRSDFLDKNSAHVPVFLIGSSTKKGHAPYHLTHIYEIKINTATDDVMVVQNDNMVKNPKTNICYEFSLNYKAPNGIINKQNYDIQEKYMTEIHDLSKNTAMEEDVVRNYGIMSMHSVHDAHMKEVKDLLDALHQRRADDYGKWRDVLSVLAGTSLSYKELAEYFSRKSTKFNMVVFEKTWSSLTVGFSVNKKLLTMGSLHYWARLDNPDRYEQIRNQTVYTIINNMVYEHYKDGMLQHADIARVLHKLLQHKFITDIPDGEKYKVWYEFILDGDDHVEGELYKWHRCKEDPVSLSLYISDILPAVFNEVLIKLKKTYEKSTGDVAKYYSKVMQNFKATMRNLHNRVYKQNVIREAMDKFNRRGFSESLDRDPLIRGVRNGVLKLSLAPSGKPILVQGYHSYNISKYTTVPYIAFNPYDPLTKDIVISLRNLFPDNEPDSFEFTMYYLASTIDGNPKESMFMIMVGSGSNGKTFLVELHRGAIGNNYGVKMPLSYLTCKSTNADNATPAQMLLKDASLATYSESNRLEVLNAARIKEVTGLETLAGRKLHQDMVNFKPRCHHLVTTNYDFVVECNDHGTWRRIEYNPLKITFIDTNSKKYNEQDPYQRIANDVVTQQWTEDPEVQGRYLGYMVWMHYFLYRKYKGKVKSVPHPHIAFETDKYRRRQDVMSAFIAQRFVKVLDEKASFPMATEVQKYVQWYNVNHGGILPAKGITEQFQNSEVGTHIKLTKRGLFLIGHRFLDNNEQPSDGEEYVMKNIYDIAIPDDNFGIASETPLDYYNRLCKEYDTYKHIFDGKPVYDIDIETLNTSNADNGSVYLESKETYNNDVNGQEINGRILPCGVVLRALEEPSVNYLLDDYYTNFSGYLTPDTELKLASQIPIPNSNILDTCAINTTASSAVLPLTEIELKRHNTQAQTQIQIKPNIPIRPKIINNTNNVLQSHQVQQRANNLVSDTNLPNKQPIKITPIKITLNNATSIMTKSIYIQSNSEESDDENANEDSTEEDNSDTSSTGSSDV